MRPVPHHLGRCLTRDFVHRLTDIHPDLTGISHTRLATAGASTALQGKQPIGLLLSMLDPRSVAMRVSATVPQFPNAVAAFLVTDQRISLGLFRSIQAR